MRTTTSMVWFGVKAGALGWTGAAHGWIGAR